MTSKKRGQQFSQEVQSRVSVGQGTNGNRETLLFVLSSSCTIFFLDIFALVLRRDRLILLECLGRMERKEWGRELGIGVGEEAGEDGSNILCRRGK